MTPITSDSVFTDKYTAPTQLEAVGAHIGIISCKRCGCALILDARDMSAGINVVDIHDDWHRHPSQIQKI